MRRETVDRLLRENPSVAEMADNPLLLSLICAASETCNLDPRTTRRQEVYDAIVEQLYCSVWKETSPSGQEDLSAEIRTLQHVAWELLQTNPSGMTFHSTKSWAPAVEIAREGKLEMPVSQFRTGLRKSGLVVAAGRSSEAFLHRTFLAHLAAAHLAVSPNPMAEIQRSLLRLAGKTNPLDQESGAWELVRVLGEGAGEVHLPSRRGWYCSAKPFLERCVAACLLIALAPVILFCIVLVRLTSPGPGLYWQVRVGRNRHPYMIYKIRTMAHNCEAATGARWSGRGDSRITWLGRWLRRTHLDELPQLWNVLRGEMSLIGPRPERPEITSHLAELIPSYYARMRIHQGMTGLAQMRLPPDTNVEGVRRKLCFDLYYILNESLWLDLRIALATSLYLMGFPGDLPCRVAALPVADAVIAQYLSILFVDSRDNRILNV
jgi:lipopolysaccharide/colanic/teichoic acid biosynthesis glycosyltransferase